jgi:hypothetical protein
MNPSDAADPLRAGLRALYAELDEAVARLGPVCRVSGCCCRFVEYDHTLFVSAAEVDLLLEEAPPPVRTLDDGATCPWQDCNGRCTAREARPLGCRVYFCDPAYAPHAPELSEAFLARLKRLADDHGHPWSYAPLHRHLEAARRQGRLPETIGRNNARP